MQHPTEPVKKCPESDWSHYEVWQRVKGILESLPIHFRSDIAIRGIHATDIHSIGSLLSTTIETRIVELLNDLRSHWDPELKYINYCFKRQAQSFPDIIFANTLNKNEEPLFGIELKAWYVLSKEKEPSFRFKIDPDACAVADMLVIFPWLLSDVLSGNPKLLEPFIEGAKYCAEYRNWAWETKRENRSIKESKIKKPDKGSLKPYPKLKDIASDSAIDDKGGNFGRIARTGILDEYLKEVFDLDYLGIKLKHWTDFFKSVAEYKDKKLNDQIEKALTAIENDTINKSDNIDTPQIINIKSNLIGLINSIMNVD